MIFDETFAKHCPEYKPISDEEAKEKIETIVEITSKFFKNDNHKGLIPTIHINYVDFSTRETSQIFAPILIDDFSSEILAKAIYFCGQKSEEEKFLPRLVILSSEVWISPNMEIRPSDSPNKVEGIAVTAMTPDSRGWSTLAEVKRTEDNFIKLGEWCELTETRFPLLEQFYKGYFSFLDEIFDDED